MALMRSEVLDRTHRTINGIHWQVDVDGDIRIDSNGEGQVWLNGGDINEMNTAISDLYYARPDKDRP